MQRLKDLRLRQKIYDDIDAIDPVDIRNKVVMDEDQFEAFCTIKGVSDQIDAHLDARNPYGRIFWMDPAGVLMQSDAHFDFIF